jgi:plasmid stabilization system protein ParE
MDKYKVQIEPEVLVDIQEITDWYNEAKAGLGTRFQRTAIIQINSLNKEPHIYAVRYREIRCMVIEKFPYMTHFYINEGSKTVEVLAVLSTSRNPKIWLEKTSKH